jgi:hypothetical protein
MATTTPNFGWSVPTSTDLVKDGATAIETLGDSIDASLVDLKGGTTGQVLAKASATDMDFSWVAQDDSNAIQNAIVDAKGDLIAATANDTPARLAVGTNGQVLKANSATATGLEWGSVAATKSYSLLGTGTLTSGSTVTVSGISNMDSVFVTLRGAFCTATNQAIRFQINGDTATNYAQHGAFFIGGNAWTPSNMNQANGATQNHVEMGQTSATTGSGGAISGAFLISGAATSGVKVYQLQTGTSNNGVNGQGWMYHTGGVWNNTASITSISIITSGTFSGGTFNVYGSA